MLYLLLFGCNDPQKYGSRVLLSVVAESGEKDDAGITLRKLGGHSNLSDAKLKESGGGYSHIFLLPFI